MFYDYRLLAGAFLYEHSSLNIFTLFIQRNSQLTNQKQGGGTYKLSMESSECDGELDVQYVTINGLKVSTWDYDGDDKEWD